MSKDKKQIKAKVGDLTKVDTFVRFGRVQISTALKGSVKKVNTQGGKKWGHDGDAIGDN